MMLLLLWKKLDRKKLEIRKASAEELTDAILFITFRAPCKVPSGL